MSRPDIKFGAAVAGASKDRVIRGTVIDVLGDRCSIRLANNGRILRGLPYTGGPISVGTQVLVDYSSGRPIAQIYGEAYQAPIVQGKSRGHILTDVDSERGGWVDGAGYGGYHYHYKIMQFNGTALPAEYAPTSAGALTAFNNQKRGDVLLFPPGNYGSNYTLSSGNVKIVGAGVSTIFSGLFTITASTSTIQNVSITRSNSSAGSVRAVHINNATSNVNIYNSVLLATNSSTGGANAIQDGSSAGTLVLWKASVGAVADSGVSTAIVRTGTRNIDTYYSYFLGDGYFNSTPGIKLTGAAFSDGSFKMGRAGSYTNTNSTGYLAPLQCHGELYTYENSVSVSAVAANTYYAVAGLTNGMSSGTGIVTLNGTNGTMTIGTYGGGRYKAAFNISMSANKPCTLHADIFINSTQQVNLAFRRDIGTANQIGAAGSSGILDLVPTDVISVRMESDTTNTTIDIDHMNVNIERFAQ